MINRAALILRYKAPAVRWINEVDPMDNPLQITSEDINSERTIYLISEEDGDNNQSLEYWIKRNFRNLFESELEGWYTDPGLWPRPLTLRLFREWFEVECHTVLIDTVGGTIYDDGI
ncbi:hypothetical protein [Fodinibius sediminis]|uniref:Uncharacterized protein n=1 Tax=Fodinibius sediminis TaxID=1214077 RepID=A0A521EL23_9BACT|nr:hypothetical protein [Fodinibius sediminis]SMO84618.1 hypothetical protein SAMN06265218_11725 [Fodinibius sediminis]